MEIVITGHTSGIGKALYDHFINNGDNVIGLSRTNGYDIEHDFDNVVTSIAGCNLFINNAYRDQQQLKLFNALKGKVDKIVCMGSISRLYPELIPTDYVTDKQELYNACRLHNLTPNSAPALHLDLSFIEHTNVEANDPTSFTSDNHITFAQIISAIDYWLLNPVITNMEFKWKCTPFVRSEFERINPSLDPSRISI